MMYGLSVLVMTLLGAQSVFALGLLMQAVVSTRIRQPQVTQRIKQRTAELKTRKKTLCIDRSADAVGATLEDLIRCCRVNAEQPLIVSALCEKVIGHVDGGARSLAAFLSSTSGLLGLAGTLIGISSALISFSANADSPEPIITGFATAIGTTLWGVLIAFTAIFTSRLIWQPAINDAEAALTRLLLLIVSEERKTDSEVSHPRRHSRARGSLVNGRPAMNKRRKTLTNGKGSHVQVIRKFQ